MLKIIKRILIEKIEDQIKFMVESEGFIRIELKRKRGYFRDKDFKRMMYDVILKSDHVPDYNKKKEQKSEEGFFTFKYIETFGILQLWKGLSTLKKFWRDPDFAYRVYKQMLQYRRMRDYRRSASTTTSTTRQDYENTGNDLRTGLSGVS